MPYGEHLKAGNGFRRSWRIVTSKAQPDVVELINSCLLSDPLKVIFAEGPPAIPPPDAPLPSLLHSSEMRHSASAVQASRCLCHSPVFICRFVITCCKQSSEFRGGGAFFIGGPLAGVFVAFALLRLSI
jgi:hypothetical protein